MRRLVRWLIGVASALAIWRVWSRRHRQPDVAPEPDPAEELRRKLAETRDDEPLMVDEPETPETLDTRRARVHAKAQEAMDAMREEEP